MTKNKTKVVMYASNFSGYGKVQAMKSTLQFLARDAGFLFIFVNDPERGNQPKVNYGGKVTRVGISQPYEMNQLLESMQDKHKV